MDPREVIQVMRGLNAVEEIKSICAHSSSEALRVIADQLNPCLVIRDRIGQELNPEPPVALNKGNVIKSGVSPELDEYRQLLYSSKDYLEQVRQREIEKTGIPSLKISFNNVFGYYLEVTNAHKDKVPPEWERRPCPGTCAVRRADSA